MPFCALLHIFVGNQLIIAMLPNRLSIFFVLLLFLVSCSNKYETLGVIIHEDRLAEMAETTKVYGDIPNYNVSIKDAYRYVSSYKSFMDFEIEPVVYKQDTLMYICNHSDGWMIIAGDKRLQPEIAKGRNGKFNLSDLPEGIKVWLDSYAEDIYNTKQSSEIIENENTRFWEMYAPSNVVVNIPTKSEPEMKWYAIDYGPYILSTYTTDVVPHLVSVKWGQQEPWNTKCPIDATTGRRCVLGCTAVAVSQLLHYTNTYLGKPTRLYHNISCSVDTVYSKTANIGFSRSNLYSISSRWQDMALDYTAGTPGTEYAGDLMLDVGNRFGMKYSSSGSSAAVSSNLSNLYDYYGLDCYSSNYSSSTVLSSIHNNLPVLVTAYSERGGFLNLIYSRGHSWLIDGIRRETKEVYFLRQFEYSELWTHYSEVYDSFDDITRIYGITDPNDQVEVRHNTVSNDYLLMNWGYDGSWDEDLFNTYESADWPANNGNHQYKRKIYYGFN